MVCKDRYGNVMPCPPTVIETPEYDTDRPYYIDEDGSPIAERDSCAVNLPSFVIATKNDLAKAVRYIVKNNSRACVGPAFEKLCARIPVSMRKLIPRNYRSSCNANTGRTGGALMGMDAMRARRLGGLGDIAGLGSYSTRDAIVAAVKRCKQSRNWGEFNKCAVDLIANTTPEAAKFLPTPFRQMYAAEQKAGMGDAIQDSNTVATIFNQWVSSLSNAAGAITQNYVQIRAATGKQVPPPTFVPVSGGDNTLLYVGGAAALVLVLMMAKK